MSAPETRRFDPANDRHYALSEDDQVKLRNVADAAEGLGILLQQDLGEGGGLADHYVGALLLTISHAIGGVLEDRIVFRSDVRHAA